MLAGLLLAAGAAPLEADVADVLVERIADAKQHNVVFILSDDHRYDFMGFMDGPEFLETPQMDRLAAAGAHLQNAFVATSLCSPSRASPAG